MWDKLKWFSSGNLTPTLVISALLLAGTLTHMFYYKLQYPAYNFNQCLSGTTVVGDDSPSIRAEPLVEALVFSGIPISLFLVVIFLATIRFFGAGAGVVTKIVSIVFLVVAVLQIVPLTSTVIYDNGKLQNYYENIDNYRPC